MGKILFYIYYLNPFLYIYYLKNLRLPFNLIKTTKRIFPIIDPYIMFRKPELNFKNGNLRIENIYTEDEEVREDPGPYKAFFKTLDSTFKLSDFNSILDIGCATGLLIHEINKQFNDLSLNGLEFFEYHKKNAPTEIKDKIIITDIRNEVIEKKYDIVICTEVAEHIEPKNLTGFLYNLENSCNQYLIVTWSSTYPAKSGPPQHVSSLPYKTYKKIIESYGFKEDEVLTSNFLKNSLKQENFTYWWRDSLIIFKKI